MPAYIKLPGIDGEVEEKDHQKWIEVGTGSMPIYRSITEGSKGSSRENGETSLGDFVVVKQWDSSTPQIAQAAADGKLLNEVKIHFCSTINNKNVTNLEIKLKNVIITSYQLSINAEQSPPPSEQLSLNYTKVDWTYKKYDRMGDEEGNFPGSYDTQASG
jgi:type VI secretion system Hcp family effector